MRIILIDLIDLVILIDLKIGAWTFIRIIRAIRN